MKQLLHRLLAEGIEQGVFPGAAAAVALGTGTARKKSSAAAGIMDRREQSSVTENTCFDLASLSKALSTTLIFYSLFAEDRIQPDDTLASLLLDADIQPDKRQISVRRLLSHSSGFAAYQPWFKEFPPTQQAKHKRQLFQRIFNEPLAYTPKSRCLYSDLGFMLLGHLAEQVTGKGLVTVFRERISVPLGLENDLFHITNVEETAAHYGRCAATEDCAWRGRVIRAEAHDEHCWLMQGAAGHAGLFGTAEGVLRLCGAILDQWTGAQPASGDGWAGSLRQGLRRQIPGQTWCLGFDTPSIGTSSSGRHFSPDSVGHLGFTGTSFWIDPERELIAVLLTNRVHPSRENMKIREFRPYFHDRIAEAVRTMR